MKFKHTVFSITFFLFYIGFFFLYWFTALFAEAYLMDERGGDAFGRTCYLINDNVFFLQSYAFDLKLDKMIGMLPTHFLVIFVMSLICTYIIEFFEALIAKRKNSNKVD
ncbi:MAG: hypothetical protein V4604_00575 [Bacteroidota bacterium]